MKSLKLGAAIAALALCTPLAARAAAYTVPDHFSSIQEAVGAAASGDTIYVRPGIYYENVVVTNKSLTVQSLGGPAQTVLDGQRLGPSFRAYGIGNVVVDGFTVQNGTVGVDFQQASDGVDWLSGTVQNSVIVNNDRGVGINGDGFRLPPFAISRCTIANTGVSGGFYVALPRLAIHDSVIANNHSTTNGGGFYGGFNAAVEVDDSFVTGNSTDQSGGGVATDWQLYVRFVNSVIDHNTAAVEGGGVYAGYVGRAGDLLLQNTTVAANTAPVGGGVFQSAYQGQTLSTFKSMNSIVWGNSSPPGFQNTAMVAITNSDLEGGVQPGTGNISADPLFVNAAARNYQLFAGSPAINTGGGTWYPPGVDLLGVARPQGAAIDMGAYEWTEAIPPVSTASVTGTLGENGIYVSPATVTLTAEDLYGVREIHYVVNGAETVVTQASASFALSADGSYAVSWWAVDAYGNAEAAKALPTIFVDATPPAVASTTPAAGATGVARNASVVVTFSEAVAAREALAGVTLSLAGVPVAATATVSGAALTVTPSALLASDAIYTLTVPAGAVADAAGSGNAEVSFAFTTEAADVTAPAVASTSPANGATNVLRAANVLVTFGEDVAPGPNFAGIVLKRGSTTVTVARTLSGSTVTLDPTTNMASSTTYAVTVPAGAVVDAAGNQNAAMTFGFKTGSL